MLTIWLPSRKNVVFLIFFLILLSNIVVTGYEGQCAFDFLNIPVGANSSSLGQVNFSGMLGPEALFGNPALIGQYNGLFASHQELFLDTRSDAMGISYNLSSKYALGLALNYFNPGQIIGYTTENIRTENIRAGDYMAKLAFSINGQLSYGGYLSYYYQRLDNFKSNAVGIGLGISYENHLGRFGMVADNIGPDVNVETGAIPLPLRLTWSGLFTLSQNIRFNGDLTFGRSDGWSIAGGIQYAIISNFMLRAGSNSGNPISLGCGFENRKWKIDYSYLPVSDFGERHFFSITILK